MTDDRYERVELALAQRGSELWAAIEAAQFARIIAHDDPDSEAEADALESFIEVLAASIDDWEATPAMAKSAVLDSVGVHLDALERVGLFVHWATVERDVQAPGADATSIPMAVVTIGRVREPTVAVVVPMELDVEE